jgi:purine-nucleoside phosphorylase
MPRSVEQAVQSLQVRCSGTPSVGVVLGSGWGAAAAGVAEGARAEKIPYGDIPGFPPCSVEGHLGTMVVGRGWGPLTAVLQGRTHRYEGDSWDDVTFPVRVLGAWGVKTLVVTNASGGLQGVEPGDLVLIVDHINLMGENPLIGATWTDRRLVDMAGAYDPALMQLAEEVARDAGIPVRRGTLAALSGPTYETPAEARMLRILGANMACMSTVPEVIVARVLGIRVLGLSLVTNMSGLSDPGRSTHDTVVAMGERKTDPMARLLRGIVGRLHG